MTAAALLPQARVSLSHRDGAASGRAVQAAAMSAGGGTGPLPAGVLAAPWHHRVTVAAVAAGPAGAAAVGARGSVTESP